MTRRQWVALFLLGLLVVGLTAALAAGPGYMDSEYYTAIATQLAEGAGLTEPFLWNYLDDPAGIPHPSHLYWMPLPSLLAAGGMVLFGGGWRAAQLPFVVLGALLPLLTAAVALRLTREARLAWRAGLLALVPGFFLPYLGTVDSFALYACVGTAILWLLAGRDLTRRVVFIAGLAIAAAHLTRADGILFFVPACAAVLCQKKDRLRLAALLVGGYMAGMAPWWLRNLLTLGVLMPDTSHAFWLTSYDDLFAYPAGVVNMQAWLESGWEAILRTRWDAFVINGQRVLAEIGMVFLLPFMLLGAWRLRAERMVRLGALYFAALFFLMTIVFPFAGANGGMFHSGAALLPLMLALTPVGIRSAVQWASSRRGWKPDEPEMVFSIAALCLLAALTLWVSAQRLGWDPPGGRWQQGTDIYRQVDERMRLDGLGEGILAVNNPPGFYLESGRPAVVIPNGGPAVLEQVVDRYGAAWVLLEYNHPAALDALYQEPDSLKWLEVALTLEDSAGRPAYLLRVLHEEASP